MKYRFGIIINFERHVKMIDTTNIFHDVDLEKLLGELVKFLTDDVVNVPEMYAQMNEIDYLVNMLHDKRIIDEHLFYSDEPYLKICGVLYALSESLAEILIDSEFYKHCNESNRKPEVIRNGRKDFTIAV